MKDVTLVAIEFQWHDLTKYALERSLENIQAKDVLIISDKEILPGARHIIRDPVANIAEYANIMLKGVNEHVTTGHALYVQWDGIANNKHAWTDEFLKYDYIGAPWPWKPEGQNVGNGGFSLRSKSMLEACQDPEVSLTKDEPVAEDNIMCIQKRSYLETAHNIKFAPTTLAQQFSFEHGTYTNSFGFHGLWNVFNLMSDADMDYFVAHMDYTKWNIYKWHHVLAAVTYRERWDIYVHLIEQLTKNNPELLDPVSQWLERDSENSKTGIVVE